MAQEQKGKGKQSPKQQPQKAGKEDEFTKAQQLFDNLKEANGNVPTSKLRDFLKQQGMDDTWTNKALDQIDVNHDNEITWAEFGTKGIRVVQQLKLHADKVARESAKNLKKAGASKEADQEPQEVPLQKKAPAKEVEQEAPREAHQAKGEEGPAKGASPAPAHRDVPSSPSAHAASAKSPKGEKQQKQQQPKQQKGVKGAKGAKEAKPAEPVVAQTFGLPPSAFEDLVPIILKNKNIQHKNKLRDKQEVRELIQQTRPAGEYKAGRRKKKFPPKKPTHDERGVFKRLKKHEATKAPAFEKSLLDKYKLKKKAAPAPVKK